MRVEDFVILGRTVPEDSKKYGKKVCMAGYSAENNQLLRVYPLLLPVGPDAGTNPFVARHRYAVDLRRNADDTRQESWRVVDERDPTMTPAGAAAEVKKHEVMKWLESRAVPSVKCLNDCKLSLGVLSVKAASGGLLQA